MEPDNTGLLYELRPRIAKAFGTRAVQVIVLAGLLVAAIAVMSSAGVIEPIISSTSWLFGEIDTSQAVQYAGYGIGIIALMLLLFTYASTAKLAMRFYADKVAAWQNVMFVLVNSSEIAYSNVVSIEVKRESLDSMLNTGTIVLKLSGLAQPKIAMPYVDDPLRKAQHLQEILVQHRNRQAYLQAQKERIDNIIEQF